MGAHAATALCTRAESRCQLVSACAHRLHGGMTAAQPLQQQLQLAAVLGAARSDTSNVGDACLHRPAAALLWPKVCSVRTLSVPHGLVADYSVVVWRLHVGDCRGAIQAASEFVGYHSV
jgi:hypothetical protein